MIAVKVRVCHVCMCVNALGVHVEIMVHCFSLSGDDASKRGSMIKTTQRIYHRLCTHLLVGELYLFTHASVQLANHRAHCIISKVQK